MKYLFLILLFLSLVPFLWISFYLDDSGIHLGHIFERLIPFIILTSALLLLTIFTSLADNNWFRFFIIMCIMVNLLMFFATFFAT